MKKLKIDKPDPKARQEIMQYYAETRWEEIAPPYDSKDRWRDDLNTMSNNIDKVRKDMCTKIAQEYSQDKGYTILGVFARIQYPEYNEGDISFHWYVKYLETNEQYNTRLNALEREKSEKD